MKKIKQELGAMLMPIVLMIGLLVAGIGVSIYNSANNRVYNSMNSYNDDYYNAYYDEQESLNNTLDTFESYVNEYAY